MGMEFQEALLNYDKEKVMQFAREKLESGYGVENFYRDYLFVSLSQIGKGDPAGKYNIPKEHICIGILRSVIEICYEYILKERKQPSGKRIVISGLEHELHELAPRVTSDFFSLNGFESYFLGTNIPNQDILDTIKLLKADYVGISVTNFLHLTTLDDLIQQIRQESSCKIVIGGLAVINNMEYCEGLAADYVLSDVFEIGGILDETCD